VVLLAVTACAGTSPGTSSSTSPTASSGPLKYPGGGVAILAPPAENGPVTFGSLELCADRPVTITAMTGLDSHGGATVSAWGHRPNPFATNGTMLGAETASLTALGFTGPPVTLSAGCGAPEGTNPEFAVSITRGSTPGALSYVTGIRVTYTDSGTTRSLDVPWTLGYCGTGDKALIQQLGCKPS
jgi:hypothetical protein